MVDLAKENLKLPAQIGFPDGLSGLVDKIDDPSCSVMAGAVLWIMEEGHQSISSMPQSEIGKKFNMEMVNTAKKWLKDLLPGN